MTVVNKEIITWNMQGAISDDSSKWDQVRDYRQANVDILGLQEGGPPTSLPNSKTPIDVNVVNPNGVNTPFVAYRWNPGSFSRPEYSYIYFLYQTGRCNLAIVSKNEADEVILLKRDNPFDKEYRHILGIRLGNDYFFTIHAMSRGGNNAAGLVDRTFSYMQERNNNSWMLMGDFNRNSSSLMDTIRRNYGAIADGVAIVDQPLETQISGGNLDYAVVPVAISGRQQATRLNKPFDGTPPTNSDHYPVQFSRRQGY